MDEKELEKKMEEIASRLEKAESLQAQLKEQNESLKAQLETEKAEATNTLAEKENAISDLSVKFEEVSKINKEYKTKERIEPVKKWFESQDEATKETVKNSIVEMDDTSYNLFIDGKVIKDGEQKQPPKKEEKVDSDVKDQEPLPNPAATYDANGGVKDPKEEKSVDEIYSAENGFTILQKWI